MSKDRELGPLNYLYFLGVPPSLFWALCFPSRQAEWVVKCRFYTEMDETPPGYLGPDRRSAPKS